MTLKKIQAIKENYQYIENEEDEGEKDLAEDKEKEEVIKEANNVNMLVFMRPYMSK